MLLPTLGGSGTLFNLKPDGSGRGVGHSRKGVGVCVCVHACVCVRVCENSFSTSSLWRWMCLREFHKSLRWSRKWLPGFGMLFSGHCRHCWILCCCFIHPPKPSSSSFLHFVFFQVLLYKALLTFTVWFWTLIIHKEIEMMKYIFIIILWLLVVEVIDSLRDLFGWYGSTQPQRMFLLFNISKDLDICVSDYPILSLNIYFSFF